MKLLLNKFRSLVAIISVLAILAVSLFSSLSGVTFTVKADASVSVFTGEEKELSLLDNTQPNSRSNPFIIENANQMFSLMRGISTYNGETIDTTGKYFNPVADLPSFYVCEVVH